MIGAAANAVFVEGFNSPASIGGYADYKRARLREIASGYRMPYEVLSGDLSDVNFSSIRAGLVEFRRFIKMVQTQVFIPMFLEPLWRWFTEAAYAAGQIEDAVVPVKWSLPKFEWVDPYKDAMTEVLSIRAGTRTWAEIVAEHGREPDEVIAEIVAWNKLLDQNNLTLDSDPRRTTVSGALQKDENADDSPPSEAARRLRLVQRD